MKKLIYNFLNVIKNFNLFFFFKLNIIILKKNYSKYPYYVKKFESALAKEFGFKYCLTFSSGTAAFYASLLSLNIKKKSKVLVSSLTFPSVIEILKKQNFEIYFFDIDKNFKTNLKNVINEKYDLLILTHPFGFYIDLKNLKELLNESSKIIFDSSHSQGINIKGQNHMKFADLSFMSLQGNKAISGGEGGVIFTDNEFYYTQMINNHHPGHVKNMKFKVAGGINDIKLRMHPLAAVIANNDLKSFKKRNNKLINKVKLIYSHLDSLNIKHPLNDNSNIGGFHFGIPLFLKSDLSSKFIKKYNWYENLIALDIKAISDENDRSFFKELYFIDLEWIKKNNTSFIKDEISKTLKDVS